MIPDDITTPYHVNPNLIAAFHHTFATVHLFPGTNFLVKDLQDSFCRPAWSILLVPVVRFNYFDI
jgi:hypothetical protein